jgi:hypothetical protein
MARYRIGSSDSVFEYRFPSHSVAGSDLPGLTQSTEGLLPCNTTVGLL